MVIGMDASQLHNRNVSIIGAARSGVGAARLLLAQGARPFVSDLRAKDELVQFLSQLDAARVPYETGGHTERVYDCSLMVISPGVPSNAPVVVEAQRRGIRVVSELEHASWYCKANIVAITGSNGKTTTTTLVGRILSDAKTKHVVAGNIGTAFSSVVLEMAETNLVVLEVSSFQLDHCETFRPNIAVLLNITEDHMDRYDNSMERYAASKERIFMNQRTEDLLIHSADDPWTLRTVPKARSRRMGFSVREALNEGAFLEGGEIAAVVNGKRMNIVRAEEISIKGIHNLSNAMAAALVGLHLGVNPASIRATLRNFKGVEHRLEFVQVVDGVRYYNDSKATNVDAVWYALQAFDVPVVLLLGGRDKGNEYSRLTEVVKSRVRAIVAVGESAEKVERSFAGVVPVERANSMEQAVSSARRLARHGDVVLLSPACASFDWFKDYEHRGKVFKELVRKVGSS